MSIFLQSHISTCKFVFKSGTLSGQIIEKNATRKNCNKFRAYLIKSTSTVTTAPSLNISCYSNNAGPPLIHDVTGSVDNEGAVLIRCFAIGYPPASMTYYWGHLEISAGNPPTGHSIVEDGAMKIEPQYLMPHTCKAANRHGEDTARIEGRVLSTFPKTCCPVSSSYGELWLLNAESNSDLSSAPITAMPFTRSYNITYYNDTSVYCFICSTICFST